MKSKTALITGASSGIGKELARIHAEKKGDLILVARREDKLNELKAELESAHQIKVNIISKDLAQPNAGQEIYDEVRNQDLTVDYLINNAGFGGQGLFHERKWEDDHAMIQLNIVTLSHLCRLFLPDMVARNSGKILNVSSTASLAIGGPLQSVYFATKHFVTSFSYGLAGELHDTKVTVTALLPGATETEFAATSGTDKTKLFAQATTARSVAQDGYDAMLAGKLDVVSGLTFSQKLMLASVPFAPKKVLLSEVRKLQETS
ncbi:MAG: SDR family oxidoreductase [Verrucomicrobiota bacterium]